MTDKHLYPTRRTFIETSAKLAGASALLPYVSTAAASGDEETASEGEQLTGEEIAALVEAFDDQPMMGGQADPHTPKHVWKWVTDETFLFLELEEEDPAEAQTVNYIGIGVKGVFCAQDQPGGGDDQESEFTHFHQHKSETWDGAHGGEDGAEGYWLTHIAVHDFEAPWGEVSPGVDYEYHPTPPPECDSVPEPEFQPEGAQQLSGDGLQQFMSVFDDQPMSGGQADPHTPKHVWKWVNENVFMFLEVDTEDPAEAETVNYFGIGVRGQFSQDGQPHPDFTHFHQPESDTWDGAHGGSEGDEGYWLIHTAVRNFEAPWGEVSPGVDRAYHPTPPPGADKSAAGDGESVEVRLVARDDPPFAFEPREIEVSVGTTVRWVNDEDVFHTVTSTDSLDQKQPNGQFDGSLSSTGDTFEYAFDEPGTYHYYCQPHSAFMEGTVTVTE